MFGFGGGSSSSGGGGGGGLFGAVTDIAKDVAEDVQDTIESEKAEGRGKSGWMLRELGPAGRDRTKEYEGLALKASEGDRSLPAGATDFTYLLVPGLMTEHYGDRYMQANVARCQELGLNVSKVPIDTDEAVDVNAAVVKKSIEDAPSKCIIIGHSKGGVDAAAALALYPALKDKVEALVTLQSPLGGTHVADFIHKASPMFTAAKTVVESLFKGDIDAILDLKYDTRRAFVAAHPYDVSSVRTICFASTAEGGLMGAVISFLKSTYEVESDGLVPVLDATLPGADTVQIHDVDHGSSVGLALGDDDSANGPANITQALIVMALTKQ